MSKQKIMRKLAKWHIWLGWLVGVPLVMWTATGLVMVLKPIEEVRGNHLRKDVVEQALPVNAALPASFPADSPPIRTVQTQVERGQVVTLLTYMDGSSERLLPDGSPMPSVTETEARQIVAEAIEGGERVASLRRFDADNPPFDFRRPLAAWQVVLEDGTHVYVGTESGNIEAVRTRWWRLFDTMWGLHIMDLQTREDTSHPLLILFAALGLLGTLIGCILMFRRRKARVKVPS